MRDAMVCVIICGFLCVKLQQLEVTGQNLEAVVLAIPIEPGDEGTGTPQQM